MWHHVRFWGPVLILLFSILFVLWVPLESRFFPACPIHRTTGLLCPGCGSARSLHALLHGKPLVAIQSNLILPTALAWIIFLGIRRFRRGSQAGSAESPTPLASRLSTALAAFWALYTVARNIPLDLFSWFRPPP